MAVAAVLVVLWVVEQGLTGRREIALLLVPALLLCACARLLGNWPAISVAVAVAASVGIVVIAADRRDRTTFLLSNGRYIGAHADASAAVGRLVGARLLFGPRGFEFIRIISDTAFLRALRIPPLIDGSRTGIPLHLSDTQFHRLSDGYAKLPLWYGGYYFEIYVRPDIERSDEYVLVLPPGEFDNVSLIIASDVYAEIVR
ncbi:MAG: hypothetical protein AB7U35_13155 [Sphingobium sp.]